MLTPFLAALAAAIIVMTFFQTWAVYRTLPDRVPLGLNWNGTARSFGPRPMIWLIPLVQAFAACVMAFADYAIVTGMPGTHGTLLGSLISSVCVLAMLWRGQLLLISCARSGGKPVPMNGFWILFVVMMSIVLIDVFAIG